MSLDDMVVKIEEGAKRIEAQTTISDKTYVVRCISVGVLIRIDLIPAVYKVKEVTPM